MRLTTKEIFTIPNCLSYIRIILLPIFIYIYSTANETSDYYLAAVIILFSALTDLFDGLIARKFNQITELGKALDPIADKLQQAAIAICLMFKFHYMWIIFALFVVKELLMGINGLILLKKEKSWTVPCGSAKSQQLSFIWQCYHWLPFLIWILLLPTF